MKKRNLLTTIKASIGLIALAAMTIMGTASTAYATVPVELCTGNESGTYFYAGQVIKRNADKTYVDVSVKSTKGSWANMKGLADGSCDAAIVQADAWALYSLRHAAKTTGLDRVGVLYPEYTHVFCNREAGIGGMTDLESGDYTLAVGKPGSGGWVTMEFLKQEDEGYKEAPTVAAGGIIAATKVADGTDVQCMLANAALGNSFFHKIDSRFGDRLELVEASDGDFNDATDPKGRDLYEFADIPSGTYQQNLQGPVFSAVETIRQDAILVVNLDYLGDNESAYEALLEAYSMSRSTIEAKVLE